MIEDLGDLLAILHDLRVVISTDGNHLEIQMPESADTPELRATIAAHKGGLLDYLAGRLTVHIRPDPDPLWTDPRPDLKGDSRRWTLLLKNALAGDVANGQPDEAPVFGMLYVLRQMGARLEIAGPDNWTLRPEGPLPNWRIVRGEEMTPEEYDDFRGRYMLRHSAALAALLAAPETRSGDDPGDSREAAKNAQPIAITPRTSG